MTKTTHGSGVTQSNNWRADKPLLLRPKVSQARTIDGVKMYVGMGKDNRGKLYIKELFDKMFDSLKLAVRPRTSREQREHELHNNFL